jgi:hypothetical protein
VCSSATVDSRFHEQQVYIWAVVTLLSIAEDICRVIVNLSAIWCSGPVYVEHSFNFAPCPIDVHDGGSRTHILRVVSHLRLTNSPLATCALSDSSMGVHGSMTPVW